MVVDTPELAPQPKFSAFLDLMNTISSWLPEPATHAQVLGHCIRDLRKNKGMTRQDLADASSVAKSYIWDLEHGNSKRPSADVPDLIACALGTTLDQLWGNVTEAKGLDAGFVQLFLAQPKNVRARIRKVALALMEDGQ